MTGPEQVMTKIVVPERVSMVALLGSRDELLQVIEKALVSDVHVRGNEITITGSAADNAIATRLIDALIGLVDKGQQLTADVVERSLAMLTGGGTDRPADVLTLNIVSNRGR